MGTMTTPRRRRRARPTDSPRVRAYLRVSTDQQAESGGGMDAQRRAIELHCQAQGWTDVTYVADPAWSARDLNRPALLAALEELDDGRADVLIAKDLSRLSRSVRDFADLGERAARHGWRLICLDVDVDTASPGGEMAVNIMAASAQYQRRLTSQLTRDALAAKRAAGVRLGRPSQIPEDVVRRIIDQRADGATMQAIAAALTADGVPTVRGGTRWSSSSVQGVLGGQHAARLIRDGASA